MSFASTINHSDTSAETKIKDYILLLKPRVMSLVAFTGFAGMWVAPGLNDIHPFLAFIAMVCLSFGAGAAGGINMWFDRDIDAIMTRTKTRPIPDGRIPADEALAFSLLVLAASIMVMGLALNWMAAGLLAFASFFYAVIYTMGLKRHTSQNIVIGGAAGAFPPMIGWAAVTADVSLYPVLLFLIIFFWTPPHFWALSILSSEDYKKANVPMLPLTNGIMHTKWQMLVYTLILMPVSLSPVWFGYEGTGYGVTVGILNLFFIISAFKVLTNDAPKHAKIMFGYSIFYLFALFLAVITF